MKRLILALLSLVFFGMARAENSLTLSSVSGSPGTEVEVAVSLQNSDGVTGVQMNIPLPEYLRYVDGSATLASARSDGHQLSASVVDDVLKIMVYRFPKTLLKGNNGELLTFRLKLGREPGIYPLTPTVILSGANATNLAVTLRAGQVTILAPKIQLSAMKVDFGHVPIRSRYQQTIELKNIGTSALALQSVEFSAPEFSATLPKSQLSAGETCNLVVNYAPTVRGAVEETLTIRSDGMNGTQTVTLIADPFAVNELYVGKASGVSDSEVTIPLTIKNMDPIAGFQFSLVLPEGLEYVEGSFALNASRADGHKVSATAKDRKLTLVAYSLSSQALKGNDGEVASFKLLLTGTSGTYALTPQEASLGMAGSVNVISASYSGSVTISTPHLSSADAVRLADAPLTTGAAGTYELRNASDLPLTISNVSFQDEGYRVEASFPIVIPARQSVSLPILYIDESAGEYATVMMVYTNDPDNRAKAVNVSGLLYEPNTLTIQQVADADPVTFTVSLDNYSEISGLQLDLHWIEGMTTAKESIALTSRLEGFSYTLKQIDETTYRLIFFSFPKKIIPGHSGELFRISFTGSAAVDGTTFYADHVVLGNMSNVNRLTPGGTLSCTVKAKSNDIDMDGDLDLDDLTLLRENIMGNATLPNPSAANLNGDGRISIGDLCKLIDLLNK